MAAFVLKPKNDGRDIDLRGGGCQRFGASNTDRTCLWCGRTLKRHRWARTPHLGDYQDDAFCTLRCGYAFGVNAARLGLRLEPIKMENG